MPNAKTVSLIARPFPSGESTMVRRTLLDIGESLLLLGEVIAEAEEITPELQADFNRYLGNARVKRDHVARFRNEREPG
jgi:hypothetical protein